jgi:hypothetical protein
VRFLLFGQPLRTSNRFKVTIKHICAHRDLAILEHSIPATEFFGLEAFAGSATVGTNTLAAGFPTYGPGDRLNVRQGSISSLTTKSAVPLIEVSQMLGQGMSGGPLMDVDHAVFGIIHKGGPVAYVTKDGSVSPQRQLAVSISELKAWVLTLPYRTPHQRGSHQIHPRSESKDTSGNRRLLLAIAFISSRTSGLSGG